MRDTDKNMPIVKKTEGKTFETSSAIVLPYQTDDSKKAKVLIVDDEPLVCESISRKLQENGLATVSVTDGNQAIEELKKECFDLALLDIRMPQKSGLEILAEIKTQYPDIAVIIVTILADIDIAIGCMKKGAYDFIIKPIDFDILLLSIERALEKRRLTLENKRYQLYLEQKVKEQTERIRELFLNSIRSLAYALEAKDVCTSGHSQRVTETAINIAKAMGFDETRLEKINIAGTLHDIGKIGIPEEILNKPGKLEKHEYDIVKTHPEVGERILRSVITDEEILRAIRHHHERYDGKGYPDRLSNDQIPEAARILAVADAYDAMTSDRPYRKAMTHLQACTELEKEKGLQFDPEVVTTFLKTVTSKLKSRYS